MKDKNRDEEMIKVKCSICEKEMEMPASFLNKGIEKDKINHICSECGKEGALGDVKMSKFMSDVEEQMKKMDENNKMAEDIAKEITDNNIESLIDELKEARGIKREELTSESFFRGVWTALFLIANNHEKGFLKEEHKKIKDFHEKMYKSEHS